jgi:hypothetical protein
VAFIQSDVLSSSKFGAVNPGQILLDFLAGEQAFLRNLKRRISAFNYFLLCPSDPGAFKNEFIQ